MQFFAVLNFSFHRSFVLTEIKFISPCKSVGFANINNISTSGGGLRWNQRVLELSEMPRWCVSTRRLRLSQRREDGCQPCSLLEHFLLFEKSVYSRVNSKVPQRHLQCLEGSMWRRLRCESNQVKLDELAGPPANFPVRSCARTASTTASEVWEPEGSSCWLSAHRVYSALHR